jgi:hypothetical protein
MSSAGTASLNLFKYRHNAQFADNNASHVKLYNSETLDYNIKYSNQTNFEINCLLT